MQKKCEKCAEKLVSVFFFFKKPISLFMITCDGADITRKKEKGLKNVLTTLPQNKR